MKTKEKGFTFIEIMVVVVIISILSLIVYANVAEGRKRARDAVRIRDAREISTALSAYIVEHKEDAFPGYPERVSSLNEAPWDNFLKNGLGLDSALKPPKNGEDLRVYLSANPAEFQKYNYFIQVRPPSTGLTSGGSVTTSLPTPVVYTPLERTVEVSDICIDGVDDPSCVPACDGVARSHFFATNCGGLQGCVPDPSYWNAWGNNVWFCTWGGYDQ